MSEYLWVVKYEKNYKEEEENTEKEEYDHKNDGKKRFYLNQVKRTQTRGKSKKKDKSEKKDKSKKKDESEKKDKSKKKRKGKLKTIVFELSNGHGKKTKKRKQKK